MIYYILIAGIEILLLLLFIKRQKTRKEIGIAAKETTIRKIKNIFTTIVMFLLPILGLLCIKIRIETGEFVDGKIADVFTYALTYWILATTGRLFERVEKKNGFVKVFYWLFEIYAILALATLIKAIII